MDLVFIWEMNPEIFRVGSFAIRWYGLMYASAFLLGTMIMTKIFSLEKKPPKSIDRLLIYMLIAVVLGARLGEIIFYNPAYYVRNPLEIIKVWEGGLSSHGGVIGILTALYIYSGKTADQPYLWVLDRICIVVASGGTLIRVGNFFNSEIIGVPTKANWGIVFKRVDNIPRHPTQLYESFTYFVLFIILLLLYRFTDTNKKQGLLVGVFLSMGFSIRFMIEFVKENLNYNKAASILNTGQILSIPVILLGLFLLVRVWKLTDSKNILDKNN